jgi:TonB-dependent SusC/RagA subfamily outer membrane receptor
MKRSLLAIFACLGLIMTADAQVRRRVPQNLSTEQQPLVIVNSIETELSNIWLSPDKIKAMKVLKDSSATAIYGDRGKNGVLIIETKPSIELLKLATLLDLFNISEKDKTLKICKDKVLIQNPERILADKSEIVKIEVITDTYWVTPLIVGSEERFINIETRHKQH